LLLVENQKKEFTPISELKQIDSLLNTLEQKLYDFYQILPKSDSRRDLIDFGGTIFRTLFGTATLTDLHSLHETLDELKSRDSDVAHSLSSQISYIKILDSTVKINVAGIANLSNIVKDIVIHSNEHYQQVNRDQMWLNLTLFGQSRIFTAFRELEFILLHLIQRVDELFAVIQNAILGNLSVNLINPTTLHNILRNVFLHLPGGYELIAGTRAENIHLYYNLIRVTVLGNVHTVKIVIHVPLKTVDRHFTIYKLLVFPTRISDNKFVKYSIEFPYFRLSYNQHDFILLTEADLSHCKINSITVCPADVAVYNSQTLNCESSLFFQTVTNQHMCRRSLLLNHQTPTLRRHKTTWLYHLPESRQITLRCYINTQWMTYTKTLSGNGVITNATRCPVSTTQMHTLPELHKTSETTLNTLHLYVPEKISIVTDHETQLLEKISPELIQQLNDIITCNGVPTQLGR